MANLVNQDIDTQAILGQRYEPLIYDNTYNDHDEITITSRFHNDDGGMPDSIADNADNFKAAAQETFKKRKAMIDWKTSNQSFIKVHNELRRLGVRRNTFFLKLYDKDLQGVNPYAPSLPLDMQIKIYIECLINPWYFLREIARIPAQGCAIEPGGGIQYMLDRNNLATWYLYLYNIDHYASKPRQTGKTQDALLKLNYAYHFGSTASTMLFFNKDLGLSKENLARFKDQRDLMPTYLQMRVAFDDEGNEIKGIDNVTTMKNPVTKNSIKVMPCANSKEMGTRLGRGYTAPIIFSDEFDFQSWNTEIVMASVFAYNKAKQTALEHNSMAARLYCSTPKN